jgi:hypothetical protein
VTLVALAFLITAAIIFGPSACLVAAGGLAVGWAMATEAK